MGDYTSALQYHYRGIEIAIQIQAPIVEGYMLYGLGVDKLALKEYEEAVDYFERAIEISHNLGTIGERARNLIKLMQTYLHLNKPETALELIVSTEMNLSTANDCALETIKSLIFLKLEQTKDALSSSQRAVSIVDNVSSDLLNYQLLYNKSIMAFVAASLTEAEDFSDVIASYRAAMDACKSKGIIEGQIQLLSLLENFGNTAIRQQIIALLSSESKNA